MSRYEPETRTAYVPKEKKVTDYYQVEHQTGKFIIINLYTLRYIKFYVFIFLMYLPIDYIPQISYDRVTEYVPVERLQERVDYQAVERSSIFFI